MIHGQSVNVVLTLMGECNRCGLCCTTEHNGQAFFCENLLYEDVNDVLSGKPEATVCREYETRHNRMPIRMFNIEGEGLSGEYYCWVGTIQETRAILSRGIGNGCSLNLRILELAPKAT